MNEVGSIMKYPGEESSRLEFKEVLPKSDQVINTMIAFCNMHGGKLIVGVDDAGRVKGLPEKEVQATMEWLNEAIYAASAPPIIPQVYQQYLGGVCLLVVEVSAG